MFSLARLNYKIKLIELLSDHLSFIVSVFSSSQDRLFWVNGAKPSGQICSSSVVKKKWDRDRRATLSQP